MPNQETLNRLTETPTRLVGPIERPLDEFEILVPVPNDLSARVDHQTNDGKRLEAMNTQERFAALLLTTDDHTLAFARIRARG
ncbi:chromosome partitioning protein [Halobiforma haloterrestris]|uniref:Chromosome partitioning protein n=1 Tax=Natronobacterium haloterrestre TaxID=148448 RepID=A0A1I1L9N6_NATHA|nr:hypothetical protein [Halobiforma haloterrestris]SFC69824.1 chromosome partitioning protein [Halobiforma haloterrestris]